MSDKSIVEQIKHYQRDIVKCPDNSKRMIRCIERLHVLPITIGHLQETGVGRSVNELRKCGGEVGAAANALVCKWKSMVKDEEESDQESEVEELKSSTVDHRSNSPIKHKEVHSREDHRKSVSSHSSPKKVDHPRSDSKSPKKEDRNSSHKSDHRSSRDKSSSKSGYSSSSDSKYNSHRSKTEHNLKSHKKTSSSHNSESECNGNTKSDKSHSNSKYESKSSKTSSTSDSKTKDIKQKYDKEKSRKEESSRKTSSQNSFKKYDITKVESESSDDDSVYKPKSCSVKRKMSISEEEDKYEKKRSKKLSEKESVKKRKYESSEESDAGSGSDAAEDDHDYERLSESKTNSESEEEVLIRHATADNKMSDEELESDDNRSSAPESDDHEGSLHSERANDSEEHSDSSEKDIYVPVKIKKEKESPPRNSKSYSSDKGKSNNVKSSHSSSGHSQKYKASDNTTKKKDDKYDDVKIKKEKVDKDKINAQRHKEQKSSTDKKSKTSNSHLETSSKQTSKSDKKVKVKIEKAEDGSIDCESGASFGDALLGLSDTKKKPLKKKPTTPHQIKSPNVAEKSYAAKSKSSSKPEYRTSSSSSSKPHKELDLLSKNVKLEPLDVDLKATLPEITPNYKPLPHYSPPDSPAHKGTKLSQEDALSSIMYNKNQRTKVYSGNKSGYTKVPSLFELCTQVLRDNIEALEYTGGVPYDLLKPVLDRATADQLFQLEHYNPYLVEDTDGLWQFHCNKDFRGKKPEEFETWRELYLRLLDEREKKLEALKANISQSMAKSTPIRQTKLAYVDTVVKPPRNIARKQMKFGTGKAVKHDLVSRAMVGAAGSSPAAEPAVPVPAPSRSNSSGAAFPIPNFLKKKKAPLMAKALQLIKGNRFKR